MLDIIRGYPLQKSAVKLNYVQYYVKWVADCYTFLNVPDTTRPVSTAIRKCNICHI